MKQVDVLHYDAFSKEAGKGNPAGIILQSESLTDEEMQQITKEIGFNECTFPVRSDKADIRLRYFTPGHEMPLCGHATMASIVALLEHKRLPIKCEYTIETLAGMLTVNVTQEKDGFYIRMQQAKPQFIPFNGSVEELAKSIGINVSAIDSAYPIVYGSTGIWTLCIPIKHIEAFSKMIPNNAAFPEILNENPKASVHPFSFEAFVDGADMHARHFSSPYSGTIEDAVTGTASGVMGAYIATYVQPNKKEKYKIVVEQGQEMGKSGRVTVHIDNEADVHISISGTAVFVQTIKLDLM